MFKNQQGAAPILIIVAVIGLVLFLVVSSTGVFKNGLFALLYPKHSSHAAENNFVEAELGTVTAPAVLGNDTNASGGKYIQFGNTSPPSTTFQPTAPYHATFYYMWYKNPQIDGGYSYWQDPHIDAGSPPNTWFSHYLPDSNTASFDPAAELYSSNDYNNFKWQVAKMAEAKQEVAIASWWGQGGKEDLAFKKIMNDFMGRVDNPYPNLRWSTYYEQEGFGDPSVVQLVSDLSYIQANYANSPYYLKINGKPVVFVYNAGTNEVGSTNTNCQDTSDTSSIHRWYMANSQLGNPFNIVLKVYTGYATNPCQPYSWHQYAPAARSGTHGTHSAYVSPGFWLDNVGSVERLSRNGVEFENGVKAMVSANATWKLTETWNEWGEGTGVEPAEKVKYNSATGKDEPDTSLGSDYAFHNLYIDILNRNLPALEAGTGR